MRSTQGVIRLSAVIAVGVLFFLGTRTDVGARTFQAGTPNATPIPPATSMPAATPIPPTVAAGGASGANGTSGSNSTNGLVSILFASCPPGAALTVGAPSLNPSGTGSTAAGTVPGTGSGYLGAKVSAVSNCGVQITQVNAGGPAAVAGLRVDDIILAIDCAPISDLAALEPQAGSAPVPLATEQVGGAARGATGTGANSAGSAATESAGNPGCISAGGTSSTGAGAAATESAGGIAGSAGGKGSTVTVTQFMVLSSLFRAIESRHPGDQVILTIQRSGQEMDVMVTLGALPRGIAPFFSSSGSRSAPTPTRKP